MPQTVLATAPQDRARVLLESDRRVHGGELFGVDPVLEAGVSQIDQFVTDGDWSAAASWACNVPQAKSITNWISALIRVVVLPTP